MPEAPPVLRKTLRRLFLTLFLRGRGARGLNKQGMPKTVGEKLALVLFFYGLMGCMALFMYNQPIFPLAVYLHGMTFVFLALFVASSSGEILFNKEEADILMHRPLDPKVLLWAKIRVMIEVSLWIAAAFNLAGLLTGYLPGYNWRFLLIHAFSTTVEAVFCTGCVVLVYQLCLRWFGRERLEGLMTMAQVTVAIFAVMVGQVVPQVVIRFGRVLNVTEVPWYIKILPPAWFAGLDDAVSGSGIASSWMLGALAVIITALVIWIAFAKLAGDYEAGLQALNETVSSPVGKRGRKRLLERLINAPPLSWWLRDPVSRASFLLAAAYLARDRDVKLRIYPGVAPVLIIPLVFLIRDQHGRGDGGMGGFGIPFSGIYLGMVPLLALQILQFSQQWQAADIFRIAPLPGPGALCHGARRAVLLLLALPILMIMVLMIWVLRSDFSQMLLLLPGIIALPLFAMVPNFRGQAVLLSQPPDAAKSAHRGLSVMLVMFVALILAGLASAAWKFGVYSWFVLGELALAVPIYWLMRRDLRDARWPAGE